MNPASASTAANVGENVEATIRVLSATHPETAGQHVEFATAFPSKLQAASQLARMCGWDAPQKVNIEAGDSLSAFLREIVTR